MRSSLTLPDRCRFGERVSIRLTCINKGSGTLKRTFEVAPATNDRSFEFVNVKGERMVSYFHNFNVFESASKG
jgi:hypothetical protein